MVFEWTDADGDTHRMRLDPSLDPSDPGWLTEIERDARSFEDSLPELQLPGTGKEYDDCGDELPVVFCTDCLEREWAGRSCRRSACPRCNESWAFNRAKTDASKSDALRRKKNVEQNTNKNKQHHVVVSLSHSLRFDSAQPLNRAKELAKVLLTGIDLDAGTLYYHPWRIAKAYRGDVAGHSSGDGDLTWADILRKLDSDSWSWEAVRDEFLVFAPHFHAIGNSRFVQGGAVTDAISEQTGIVIHRITKPESSVSIYDKEDLCRATAYCRTHTGLQWDEENEEFRAAVWRYGESANLDPSDAVCDEIDQVARDVSNDVLGVDFRRSGCSARVTPDGETTDDPADPERPVSAPEPVSLSAGPTDDRSLGPSQTDLDSSAAGRLLPDGGSMWDETVGVSPSFLEDPSETEGVPDDRDQETARCGGEMIPMMYAPQYIGDDDLRDEMPGRVEALERDYQLWQDAGGPPPD
jgi:hypothetical protein